MSKRFTRMHERLEGFQESLDTRKEGVPEARVVTVPLGQLQTAPWNARRFFEPEALRTLGEDLQTNGQIHPILVRALPGDVYEIVVGERRYRAAQQAGLNTLRAEIRYLDDVSAQTLSLAENLVREDLNPFEETMGYLQLLLLNMQSFLAFDTFRQEHEDPEYAVARLLRRYANEVERGENNVILKQGTRDEQAGVRVVGTEFEERIQVVFSLSPEMTWQSFVKNRLPLLNLPQDIKEALQRGELEYTKARVLGRVEDSATRAELLREALDHDLSLAELRERVKRSTTPREQREQDTERDVLVRRAQIIGRAIRKSDVLEQKGKLRKATRLLRELEALLGLDTPEK